VNADGCREILGIDVTSSEDGAGWLAFLRGLAARGLSAVAMVTNDDHAGLVSAVLPGAAAGRITPIFVLCRPCGRDCWWRPDGRREGRHNPDSLIESPHSEQARAERQQPTSRVIERSLM
jgi:Transposase, Mutator family